MKQYKMIEAKTQMMFITRGINAKDCIKQIEHQLGYKAKIFIIESKKVH
ncbi:MAG: hypothetical protein M0R47_15965 [Methylobacter sp.]|nr:hypothetical protein [Methylobacter sp.]MCK9622017.1 hypothetical protein [Methylobacter sp.]